MMYCFACAVCACLPAFRVDDVLQVYEGYSVWKDADRNPNFFNCSVSYHGAHAGRSCHPKSAINPLAVDIMNVHFVAGKNHVNLF
jgi:hypothetical protein